MPLPPLPPPIIALADRSRGRVFCRKQVFRAGFHDGHLTRWLRKGWTQRLAPGWYRIRGDVVPPDQMFHLAWEYLRLSSGLLSVTRIWDGGVTSGQDLFGV